MCPAVVTSYFSKPTKVNQLPPPLPDSVKFNMFKAQWHTSGTRQDKTIQDLELGGSIYMAMYCHQGGSKNPWQKFNMSKKTFLTKSFSSDIELLAWPLTRLQAGPGNAEMSC